MVQMRTNVLYHLNNSINAPYFRQEVEAMVNDKARNQATISMTTLKGVLAGDEEATESFMLTASILGKVTLGPRSTADQLFECAGCGPNWAALPAVDDDDDDDDEEAEEAPTHTHMGVWFNDVQRRATRTADGGSCNLSLAVGAAELHYDAVAKLGDGAEMQVADIRSIDVSSIVAAPTSRHELTEFMAKLPRDFSLVHQQHDWDIHRPRQLFRVPGLIERETKRKVLEHTAAKAEMKAAKARWIEAHVPLTLPSDDTQPKPVVARAPAHKVALPILPPHKRAKAADKSSDAANAPLPRQSADSKSIPPHVRHAERSMGPGIQPPSAKSLQAASTEPSGKAHTSTTQSIPPAQPGPSASMTLPGKVHQLPRHSSPSQTTNGRALVLIDRSSIFHASTDADCKYQLHLSSAYAVTAVA